MEYTQELTLVKTTYTKNSYGEMIPTETKREVLVKEDYIGTKEFYSAMSVGIRPSVEFKMRKIDYDNETEVIYKDIRYSVIRTQTKGAFDIILVVGVKDVNQNS